MGHGVVTGVTGRPLAPVNPDTRAATTVISPNNTTLKDPYNRYLLSPYLYIPVPHTYVATFHPDMIKVVPDYPVAELKRRAEEMLCVPTIEARGSQGCKFPSIGARCQKQLKVQYLATIAKMLQYLGTWTLRRLSVVHRGLSWVSSKMVAPFCPQYIVQSRRGDNEWAMGWRRVRCYDSRKFGGGGWGGVLLGSLKWGLILGPCLWKSPRNFFGIVGYKGGHRLLRAWIAKTSN